MLQKIKRFLTDGNVGIREKLFRIILLVGNVMSVLTLLLGMTMQNFGLNAIPLVLTVLVMVVATILTVKYNKLDLAAIIIGVVGFCGLLPYMFFVNGGPYSGVPIWYVLGILYMFLMFEGKKLLFFVALVIGVDAATYFIAYNNSELLTYFSSILEMYQDSLFAGSIMTFMIIANTSVTSGIYMHFLPKFYQSLRHRVVSPRMKRVTSEQPLECEPTAFQSSVFLNRFHRVGGASGDKTAAWLFRGRYVFSVKPDHRQKNAFHTVCPPPSAESKESESALFLKKQRCFRIFRS